MKNIDFYDKYNNPVVIALGFFDCIHKGHQNLVKKTKELATSFVCESALFTFSNDPNDILQGKKQIYSFADRSSVLEHLGIDAIISTSFDTQFSSLLPTEFLDILTAHFIVKAVVVGEDYTFGKNASGDTILLQNYCQQHNIQLEILPFEKVDNQKLATRSLKQLVQNGNVKTLNTFLSEPYFVCGEVIHERHLGTSIGFPTANIMLSTERLQLKFGIYATKTIVDNIVFNSMTNVGAKPTFNEDSVSVETHIFNFDSDIYGKNIKIQFIDKIRDITKFDSIESLKTQLEHDKQQISNLLKESE